MKNPFSIERVNEFVDNKPKQLIIHYCGSPIAEAYQYMGAVELHFINDQPGIKSDEWKFLGNVCNRLQEYDMEFLNNISNQASPVS